MTSVISVSGLNKSFKIYSRARDLLLEFITRRRAHRLHHVLKDVCFEVQAGESVGILGVNGAGKSTLLKIITGVLLPDSGQVQVSGRIAALLELGTGFDMRSSGRENIYLNAQLNGLNYSEIKKLENDIIIFSELEDAIDDPLRTYSSGMIMRLGFSIAVHLYPSCFILDEALAVGDASFQQKCLKKLYELREQGVSILVVSHDLGAIQMLCNRAILLKDGRVELDAQPQLVCQQYLKSLAGYGSDLTESIKRNKTHYGQLQVGINSIEVRGDYGATCLFRSGEVMRVILDVTSKITRPIVLGVLIKDKYGQDVFGINTQLLNQVIEVRDGNSYQYEFTLGLNIAPGVYSITVAIHGNNSHIDDCEYWWDNAAEFEVQGFLHGAFSGLVRLPTTFKEL